MYKRILTGERVPESMNDMRELQAIRKLNKMNVEGEAEQMGNGELVLIVCAVILAAWAVLGGLEWVIFDSGLFG